MRPRNLDEYIGQEHIIGPGKSDLRECIEKAQERRKLFGVRTILYVKEVAIV